MKSAIKVPQMGESISEASIGKILKPSGALVDVDDELLELETDKVNQVIYAGKKGVVVWSCKEGDVVKIGDEIGCIDTEAKEKEIKEPLAKETAKEAKPLQTVVSKVADKEEKKGSRISKDDFLKEITSPKPKEALQTTESERIVVKETRKKMSKVRQVIAERLVEVQHQTAMLTTFNEIDLSHVIQIREAHKEDFAKKWGARLGFMSFFVEAAVAALKEFPFLNSYIDGDEIVHRWTYNIGIAVSSERGLFVPVLKDADQMTFADIEQTIESFAKKAKEGTLSLDDLQGGTFTITNGGVFGSLLSTPILNPMQCGILGMHKIMKRPVAVDDQVVIRPMMYVALSYDHRIVDGKDAVSFLACIKNFLEDPTRLLLKL